MVMAGWAHGQEVTRDEVRAKLITMVKMIGHLPMLSAEQAMSVMDTVIYGVVGYYGRTVVMRDAKPAGWANGLTYFTMS